MGTCGCHEQHCEADEKRHDQYFSVEKEDARQTLRKRASYVNNGVTLKISVERCASNKYVLNVSAIKTTSLSFVTLLASAALKGFLFQTGNVRFFEKPNVCSVNHGNPGNLFLKLLK